jgi:hypothetical protein
MTNERIGLLETDQRAISNAIKLIKEGTVTRVEIDRNTKVYKIPSKNPKKYTIRMDVQVEEE